MPVPPGISDDVIIVGGGFSGLSIAAVLARERVPVTLLEAADLGFQASSRNQGWLHSGAWFAPRQTALAQKCYEAWEQTVRFCPSCLEPGHTGMVYAFSAANGDAASWTTAWTNAGIPFTELTRDRLSSLLPEINTAAFGPSFHLPDRAMRPQALLRHLADVAAAHGARIHTHARVDRIIRDDGHVTSVVTSNGEEIKASFVIIATGASQTDLSQYLVPDESCAQSLYRRVTLQAHLVSAEPQLCRQPFCLVDRHGFNHLPHLNINDRDVSVFGIDRWNVVNSLESCVPDDSETVAIREQIQRFFPTAEESEVTYRQWSGTTVQAMHIEQIDPGYVPLPTVIDHATESPCVDNLLSVYPGRATLWSQLAEDAAGIVLQRLQPERQLAAKPPWA